jgi:hypothetical protein
MSHPLTILVFVDVHSTDRHFGHAVQYGRPEGIDKEQELASKLEALLQGCAFHV